MNHKINKPFKFSFGIIILTIGLILLLINLDIIKDLSFVNYLNGFWAIGLILAGILIMIKQKTFGIIVLTISIILGCLILCTPNSNYVNEIIVDEKTLEINKNLENLDYDIAFGAGKFKIQSFENNNLAVEVKSATSINQNLVLEYDNIKDNSAEIEINQNFEKGIEIISDFFNEEAINDLNISINKNSNIKELDLNFGASETIIDLRNLNIEELDLEFGASDVTIFFENNLNAEINCGASDLKLFFPKNKNIVIDSQGGLIDISLEGFNKINDKYYNNYDAKNQDIEIKIEAGVSSISGGYYDE